MADYKAMYLAAMDAMERAIEALTEARQKCEDLYVETLENIFCVGQKMCRADGTRTNKERAAIKSVDIGKQEKTM